MSVVLNHVCKKIKGKVVLADISIVLEPGKVVGFRGDNGSGKTMLLRVISGLVRPSSGSVLIDGCELGNEIDFPPSLGLLIERPAFIGNKTGFENLNLIAQIKHTLEGSDIRAVLERVGLSETNARYKSYSLGMKQRLGIAAALMESPDLILLDEPTTALDTAGMAMVEEQILQHRSHGSCIVVTSHESGFLNKVADQILELQDGQIVR